MFEDVKVNSLVMREVKGKTPELCRVFEVYEAYLIVRPLHLIPYYKDPGLLYFWRSDGLHQGKPEVPSRIRPLTEEEKQAYDYEGEIRMHLAYLDSWASGLPWHSWSLDKIRSLRKALEDLT